MNPAPQKKIRKAVIPAAGFGTRFLPQTKASPKEMLPIINKPVIQYVVEELVGAGIEEIIIVTGSNKRAIEDHFDRPDLGLVEALSAPNKKPYLDEVNRVADLANFVYLRQKGGQGNGVPLINAAELIGDEPFIYSWADDLFIGDANPVQQMVSLYEQYQAPVLACTRVETDSDFDRLGIVGGQQVADGLVKMDRIVEKPGRANAPSNLSSVHSYILTPDYVAELKQQFAGYDPAAGEFMIQPSMQSLIDHGREFFALEIKGAKWCDTGTPEEYLKTLNFAAEHFGFS